MRTVHRDIAAGLVISQDGMFLFGKKDPESGGVYADCWHIPGGGIEPGETQVTALARELREEMGLDISQARVALLDEEGSGVAERSLKDGERIVVQMTFYVYRVEFDKPFAEIQVTPGDDIKTYTWADPVRLKTYALTPPSLALFTKLGWV